MVGDVAKRVLKFGLVQDGKIIDENILDEKDNLTIGSDTSNTITITEGRVPRKHRLMEPHSQSGGYKITLFEGLQGKISLGDSVYDLSELEAKGIGTKKGSYREIILPQTCKGKLGLGKTAILFQLIPPPPPPPILQLPKELKANIWSGIDLFFVTILLLSALFHITLVTILNQIEPTDALTQEVAKAFIKQNVTYEDIDILDQDEDLDEATKPKPKKGGGGGGGGGDEKEPGIETKGVLGLITKHTDSGGKVADILADSGIGGDLKDAIAGIGGVDVAKAGDGGGLSGTRPGSGGGDGGGNAVGIDGLGKVTDRSSMKTGKRMATKVKGSLRGGGSSVSGKIDQGSVRSVIRSRLGGVRGCYELKLKTNPSLAGKIRVQFIIGGSGGVAGCSVVSNTMGDVTVQNCVCRMVRRWKFPAPEEGTVTVGYTFIFSPASGG